MDELIKVSNAIYGITKKNGIINMNLISKMLSVLVSQRNISRIHAKKIMTQKSINTSLV